MKKRSVAGRFEKLRVGPSLVVVADNVGESSEQGLTAESRSWTEQQNSRRGGKSETARKVESVASKLDLERRFAYVKCAFTAGAVIAFACLFNSSILSRTSKLHWIVDNAIEAAVAVFPDSGVLRELQLQYVSAGTAGLRQREEYIAAMITAISEQIKRNPGNLELRLRRALVCQLSLNCESRSDYLQCALSDVEFVVSRRGNADDWVKLALLQGMSNDSRWRESLKQAKTLGYRSDPESGGGMINWAISCLRDGCYRQANMIPWLRALAETTDVHEGDYLIAAMYFQAGKYPEAAEEYDRLIKNGAGKGAWTKLYVLKGACLKWSGHPGLAQEAFRQCLALPDDDPVYKAMARAALGDRSLERNLNGQQETERVLYYLLSDQYQKAVQVTGTRKTRSAFDAFGPCDAFDGMGSQGADAEVGAGDVGTESFDQFEMATGLKQLPNTVMVRERKDLLEGPPDDPEMITESIANIHFLKEMAYRKINNERLAAEEHSRAISFIPANLRRELHVQ